MTVTNALDLYDIAITEQIQSKLTDVSDANFQYYPTDTELVFRAAKQNLGEIIFPLYNIFRITPAMPFSGVSSVANFKRDFILDVSNSINYYNAEALYQIDFYAGENQMNLVNKSNIDYYRFQKNALLEFDFTDLGLSLGEDYTVPVTFSDPEDNSDLSNIFEVGIYYRYTYTIRCEILLFDVIDNVEYKTLILNMYDNPISYANDDPTRTIEKDF